MPRSRFATVIAFIALTLCVVVTGTVVVLSENCVLDWDAFSICAVGLEIADAELVGGEAHVLL